MLLRVQHAYYDRNRLFQRRQGKHKEGGNNREIRKGHGLHCAPSSFHQKHIIIKLGSAVVSAVRPT